MYSREENVITCVPGKFPGECRPMLLRRKNRARGPVPSLRIDERIKTFPPELSSFRRGKGFRRICFVPARSILETRQGTKGKSSGIRGRERGEKEGRGGEREAKIRREREREGMRNRVSQTMKREEDREARNVFHGRLMDGCSQKRRAPLFLPARFPCRWNGQTLPLLIAKNRVAIYRGRRRVYEY